MIKTAVVLLFLLVQVASAAEYEVQSKTLSEMIIAKQVETLVLLYNYRFLKADIKAAATRLEKGQLILNHAVFREPVKIKFPMVAYKQPS